MSILISQLAVASVLSPTDLYPIGQGNPSTTRLATMAQILAANAPFIGQVGTRGKIRGPIKFSQLPLASIVYTTDTIMVEQGTPPVTRLATIAQYLVAAGAAPANTEVVTNRSNPTLGGLPLASAVYIGDWLIVNQGAVPTTRRTSIPPVQVPVQPLWAVIYQLHFDGVNGGLVFPDDVTSNAWIQSPPSGPFRNVNTSTAKAKFGGGSMSS